MPSSKRAPYFALTALTALFAVAACDSNVDEKIALAKLAQNCLVNSDCSSPLVCAFEACHAECESSRDCSDGARCVAAARPYKVCQLEEERQCERGSDCAEGLVCGVDGECRDQCLTDNDCVEGQLCVSGTCADTAELDEAGELTPAPGKVVGAEGAPCVYVSDCSGALLCRGQACLPQCRADRDCATTEVCQETRCVPDGSQPVSCGYNSDCNTERGERCLGGGCRCMCAEDRDCSGGQVCDGCGCVAPPDACNYDSDCDTAGQVCRLGSCACACKADADCKDGQMCDGCGCVEPATPIGGVVNGSVSIDSSLQLALYRGVTEIHGTLFINGRFIADLGDTFDELRVVDNGIQFGNNEEVTAVRFPKLEMVSLIYFANTYKLKSVELPSLVEGDIDLGTLQALEKVDLSSWKKGSFSSYALGQMKELELPVTDLKSLQISESPQLQSLRLPQLTTLRGSFSISNSSGGLPGKLSTLSAPKLTTVGDGSIYTSISIVNTALATLSDFGAAEVTVNADSLYVMNNTLLGTCAVKAFTSRFVPADADFLPSLFGNLDNCLGTSTCNLQTESCDAN
jgi:hypothetical protein